MRLAAWFALVWLRDAEPTRVDAYRAFCKDR